MRGKYEYDVFLSYHAADLEKVRPIYENMKSLGLKVFWAHEESKGKIIPEIINSALLKSMNFAAYWSADTAKSGWVPHEAKKFYDECFLKDKEHRRVFIYKEETIDEIAIPFYLLNHSRPESPENLVKEINKNVLDNISSECQREISDKSNIIVELQQEMEIEKQKVKEAQSYYRHNRFWGHFAKNKEVHVFTCGRDVPVDRSKARGYGGRTNIDMWDYRTVTDITHFFASNYPNARVVIEDPVSKLTEHDLNESVALANLANRFSYMRNMLEDKDCIIIGSPDVSDYAEMVLSQIHQIDSYAEERIKNRGFVIIKEQKTTKSSFYWQVHQNSGEKEGVIKIVEPDTYKSFPHEHANEMGASGKMYGILTVATNPFLKGKQKTRKIIIFSGFSGVATRAIAKLLTDEKYLHEFYKLDAAYTNLESNIEALIGVKYSTDKQFLYRDSRRIKDSKDSITFEDIVEI